MLLYRILRLLLRISIFIFFKSIRVLGQERLPMQGPLIVAVNHPNTLMDPMAVALLLKQRTGFLANAGIFANGFLKWMFNLLHLIPVYRQQDVKAGQWADNASSFRKCYDYLLKRGTLMIFPEGSSVNEMKLRKLKTGTARIALETAALANFSSGLLISPVSLTYSDANRFRSRLFISIDVPIAIDTYATAYKTDPVAAVQALTEVLRNALQKNMVNTADKAEELLLMRIRKLYRDHIRDRSLQALTKIEEFQLLQQIANALAYYHAHRQQDYNRIQQKVSLYFDRLEKARLKEGFFSEQFSSIRQIFLLMGNLVFLFLLFPVYILGLLTNYIPYRLPAGIAKALGTDIEYRAGIMMISGLLLFPLYYALVIFTFVNLFNTGWINSIIFIASLPVLGFFVLQYWRVVEITSGLLRFMKFRKSNTQQYSQLLQMRLYIQQELDMAAKVMEQQLWTEDAARQ